MKITSLQTLLLLTRDVASSCSSKTLKNWFEHIILVALLRSDVCLLGDPLVLLDEVVHLVLHQLVRRHSSVRACCGDTTLSCFSCVLPVLVPCHVLIFPLLLLVSLGFPVLFSLATFIAILSVVPLSLLSLATSLCLQPIPLVRLSLLVLPLGLVLLLCLAPFGLFLPLCLVLPFLLVFLLCFVLPLGLVLPLCLVLPFGLVLSFGLVLPLSPGWICLSCLPV